MAMQTSNLSTHWVRFVSLIVENADVIAAVLEVGGGVWYPPVSPLATLLLLVVAWKGVIKSSSLASA